MLSDLVEHEPDSETKIQLLMVEVDAVARIAVIFCFISAYNSLLQLTSFGVCAQSRNISKNKLNKSSKKVIQALSKVNDAFKRALQNDTPSTTFAPTTPDDEDVIALMEQTANVILDKDMKGRLESQGWSGREGLHKKIVNATVDALSKNMR